MLYAVCDSIIYSCVIYMFCLFLLLLFAQFWMSPAYGRESVAFHFTWKQIPAAYDAVPLIEEVLLPFTPRAHWGKVFSDDARYVTDNTPRFDDFKALVGKLDPEDKFGNEWTKALLAAA